MSLPVTNMVLMGSVRFDVNVKKTFPLRLNAFTLLSEATKILSGMEPTKSEDMKTERKCNKEKELFSRVLRFKSWVALNFLSKLAILKQLKDDMNFKYTFFE